MPAPHVETPEEWRARYENAVSDFVAGLDSTDVFRARLYGLSFRGPAIEAEVRLHEVKP